MVVLEDIPPFKILLKTGKLRPTFGGHRRPFCHSSMCDRFVKTGNKYERGKGLQALHSDSLLGLEPAFASKSQLVR